MGRVIGAMTVSLDGFVNDRNAGRNIGVAGSPTLVRSLLEEDLLDQLTLLVHPVVVGQGKRLFKCEENGNGLKRIKLVDSQVSSTGVAMLTYERRSVHVSPRDGAGNCGGPHSRSE